MFYKLIATGAAFAFALGFAMPASADMTTAGYYDQFGVFHVYQTYSAPTNYYGNTYGSNNPYYGSNYYGSNPYGLNNPVNQRANTPPRIWSSPATIATDGLPYTTWVNVYDSENDPITYQLISGPTGMTINPSTGQIRWDATSGQGGKSFPVTVSVTDGRSPAVTQTFTLTVTRSNSYVYNDGFRSTPTPASTGKVNNDTAAVNSNDPYGASALGSIFGGGKKKASTNLEIKDIVVTSGPMNIYEDKPATNCNVQIGWSTAVASAGQVVYGTVTQPDPATFKYQNVVPEGNSYQTAHQVTLGCLENATYYFRIIAFTDTQRVVSDQGVIAPFVVRMQLPAVPGSIENLSNTGASALGTLGKIITSPFVFFIILGVIGYLVFMKFFRKKGSHEGGHGAPAHAEPMLQIPHH